ncbi:MAG: transporter substrate-binding domain-containing protein [Solirubrobacterales bacterium]|nr:transporter substrate-binding domain-containing protein [Solirubrobacterales bacterium]
MVVRRRAIARVSWGNGRITTCWRGTAQRLRSAGVLALAAVLVAACGTHNSSPAAGTFTPRARGVLTVATTLVPSPGFWEGSAERPTGGLEYELAKDLAARFGLGVVRVVLVHFHRIVSGQLGGADLALDLITPTDARAQRLDFSAPYLNAAPTVVVRAGTSVPDLASAQRLRWGAVRATTFVGVIGGSIAPAASVKIYDNTNQMLAALERRRIDALLLDMPLAVLTAERSGGQLRAVAQLPRSETIAAALPKGSDNVDAVDSAMRAFAADGTMRRLVRQWVGPAAADAESSLPLLHTTR